MMKSLVPQTDEKWCVVLAPAEYHVLREVGTEAPFSGELLGEGREGTYRCRGYGAELLRFETKFDPGRGWPSFYDPSSMGSVVTDVDYKLDYPRTEVRCASCDSHLGHVFPDTPQTPIGQYYCIDSVSLPFKPAE